MQNTPRPTRPEGQTPNRAPRPVQRGGQGAPVRTYQGGQSPRPAQGVRSGVPARPAAARPAPRPAGASSVRGGGSGEITTRRPSLLKALIVLAAFLAAGIALQFILLPDGWRFSEKAAATDAVAEVVSTRGVRINEVMTANKNASFDEDGASADWVELFNASSSPVSITGWVLTDKASRSIRFTFPEYVMQPGDYLIVFCDGFLKNKPGDTFHAPFRLSSLGDTLELFDEHGSIVESINIPPLSEDYSYARTETGWMVTREYTPLLENTTYNYAQLTTTQVLPGSDLIINEIMASSAAYRSPSGIACDWIEVYNRGDSVIDLFGYGLSDKADKPARWRFPHVEIAPGECVVVYASGLDRVLDSGEMHANFSLSAEGESAILYSPSRQVLDLVTYDNLKSDQSFKRQPDGTWAVSTSPTPGQTN